MKTRLCILLFGISLSLAVRGETVRPDLTGRVLGDQGQALAGAMVLVEGAGPREGANVLCPSSYPDCTKRVLTDADGRYRIESLDPRLDFYVLVLAPGFAPTWKSKILPEAGPMDWKMKPRDFAQMEPKRRLRGRIIAPDGAPVAGALLSVEGFEREQTTQWGGSPADAEGMTDANGEYQIGTREDVKALHVVVSARGLTKRWARLEPEKVQLLRMKRGGSVYGVLQAEGKPLAGVALEMSTVERVCGTYLHKFQATTEPDGSFVFGNIPEGMKFQVYALMDSAREKGIGFQKVVESPADNATLNLGTVEAVKTHRLAGQVVLTDGKPLPAKMRLLLSREEAWDSVIVPVEPNGRFEIPGVPAEQVTVTVQLKGYRYSEKNPNLDAYQRGLIGRVVGDEANLAIVLEPGEPLRYDEINHPPYEEYQQRNQRPLKGAALN